MDTDGPIVGDVDGVADERGVGEVRALGDCGLALVQLATRTSAVTATAMAW
jgi:hypothetical protein